MYGLKTGRTEGKVYVIFSSKEISYSPDMLCFFLESELEKVAGLDRGDVVSVQGGYVENYERGIVLLNCEVFW